MPRTVTVKGHIVDAKTVELEEPIAGATGPVEVIVRIPDLSVLDEIAEFLQRLPPGTRSKDDIDQQIAEERDSWSR
jgi:hypothetical protein